MCIRGSRSRLSPRKDITAADVYTYTYQQWSRETRCPSHITCDQSINRHDRYYNIYIFIFVCVFCILYFCLHNRERQTLFLCINKHSFIHSYTYML